MYTDKSVLFYFESSYYLFYQSNVFINFCFVISKFYAKHCFIFFEQIRDLFDFRISKRILKNCFVALTSVNINPFIGCDFCPSIPHVFVTFFVKFRK